MVSHSHDKNKEPFYVKPEVVEARLKQILDGLRAQLHLQAGGPSDEQIANLKRMGEVAHWIALTGPGGYMNALSAMMLASDATGAIPWLTPMFKVLQLGLTVVVGGIPGSGVVARPLEIDVLPPLTEDDVEPGEGDKA